MEHEIETKKKFKLARIIDVNVADLAASLGPRDELHTSRSGDSNNSSFSYAHLLRPVRLHIPYVPSASGTTDTGSGLLQNATCTLSFPTLLKGDDDARRALNDSCFSVESFGPPLTVSPASSPAHGIGLAPPPAVQPGEKCVVPRTVPLHSWVQAPISSVADAPRKFRDLASRFVPFGLIGTKRRISSGDYFGVDAVSGHFYFTFRVTPPRVPAGVVPPAAPTWLSPCGMPPGQHQCTLGVFYMNGLTGEARAIATVSQEGQVFDPAGCRVTYPLFDWTQRVNLSRRDKQRYSYGRFLLEYLKATVTRWDVQPRDGWRFRWTYPSPLLPSCVSDDASLLEKPPRLSGPLWLFWGTDAQRKIDVFFNWDDATAMVL